MATPAPSLAPELFDESALLADYLDPSLSLLDLSERHRVPLPDLIAWSERPHIASLLVRLKSSADQRAAVLAADRAPAAVSALSAASAAALNTSAETETPALRLRAIESARKASAHILRLAPRPPKAAPTSRSQDQENVSTDEYNSAAAGFSTDPTEPCSASQLASETAPFIPHESELLVAVGPGP